MTNYNGQEDLDPLIGILLTNNQLESLGDPELDLLRLEKEGILTIEQAIGGTALQDKELQAV